MDLSPLPESFELYCTKCQTWKLRDEMRDLYWCRACRSEWNRQYEAKNRERINLVKQAYRARPEVQAKLQARYQERRAELLERCRNNWAENREARRAYKREYYKRNKEKICCSTSEYQKAHREHLTQVKAERNKFKRRHDLDFVVKERIRTRNRRARVHWNGGSHSAKDVQQILEAQKGRCNYCQIDVSTKYEVDHIKPVSKGGSNDKSNLQILCVTCNRQKLDHIVEVVYRARNGRVYYRVLD